MEIECLKRKRRSMIKNPESYKRGHSGDISTKARITVVCDNCSKEWQTTYNHYKKKKLTVDLCQSCKNSKGICGMLNKKHSNATKQKYSEQRSGENNSFWGKKHTKDQKLQWSKIRSGKVWRPPITPDECKRISKRMFAYWSGLSEEERTARLSNYDYSTMLKQILCNGPYSKLHRRVKSDMESLFITDFESECRILDYVVDECSENRKIVIEVNGDYWHANPDRYQPDELITYPKRVMSAREVWHRDMRRESRIREAGYRVITLWESDIHSNKHLKVLRSLS